jgi:hypothetical protein
MTTPNERTPVMKAWNCDELTRIGNADELQISSARRDGSLRKPVTIWVVPHGDDLYVRSANGTTAGWYRGTQLRHEGHISAGGIDTDVTFTNISGDDDLQTQLNAAYRSKYRRYGASYVDMMLAPQARATTLKLTRR